jgi:hypothetical protein
MDTETYNLYQLLNSITLTKVQLHTNRFGFNNNYRQNTFGYVRQRFTGKTEISLYSRKYPKIYLELIKYGDKICPHPFTSIHVVKNLVCTPHKDGNNVGESTIISFGEYTGCKLVIENEIHDAFCNPITFNGFEKMHWNTNDLIGTKYSLIFFNCKKGEILSTIDFQD